MDSSQTRQSLTIPRILFFLLFWAAFWLALDQSWRYESLVRAWLGQDAIPFELRYMELMPRYTAILTMALAVWGYRGAGNVQTVRAGIAFLLWGLFLAFSEGDFIQSKVRMIFAPLLVLAVLFFVWRASRGGLLVFLLGCVVLALATVGDKLHDEHLRHAGEAFNPGRIGGFLIHNEDQLEMLASAIFCYAALSAFFEELYAVVSRHALGAAVVVACLLLLTAGNCFLHFTVNAGEDIKRNAFLASFAAAMGINLANELLIAKPCRLGLYNESALYVALFLCCVVLPTIYTVSTPFTINFLIVTPVVIYIVAHLYFSHPLSRAITSAPATAPRSECPPCS